MCSFAAPTATGYGSASARRPERRHTAVFGLAEEQEAVTAIPQPAAEGGGFDWRWLLVLPAGAGVVGLVFLGRFLLQKYKSKKEWKEYNK